MVIIKKYDHGSDLELLARILSGDIGLYEIIIRRYNPYLFKVGRSYGFNQQDTEDLIQESFISAYTNLGRFEKRSSLKTWLVRIMLNHCYHQKQKSSFRNELPSDSLERKNVIPMFAKLNSGTHETVMNNELKAIIEDSILRIPEDYRLVFVMRELNAMSIRETSEVLNISESNVKMRLGKAKGMLRSEIQKMYSPEEIFDFNLVYCNRIVTNVLKSIKTKPVTPVFQRFFQNLKNWIHG